MIFTQILYFSRRREKVTSNSIIPYSFITQKTFIKSNFPSSWFGYPEVQLIEERQDKCLVLLLYLLVFKMKRWFPSILQRRLICFSIISCSWIWTYLMYFKLLQHSLMQNVQTLPVGASSRWLLNPFDLTLMTSLLSIMTRCFNLILYLFFVLRPELSHFFKKPWFLFSIHWLITKWSEFPAQLRMGAVVQESILPQGCRSLSCYFLKVVKAWPLTPPFYLDLCFLCSVSVSGLFGLLFQHFC